MALTGSVVLAKALKQQGAQRCYGICGIPVIELGYNIQGEGIEYYGFRNEQAASYAAGADGYMSKI